MHKPSSSKLFKLKQWLTLPEAARYLSVICGETVTEADILQLSLEGHLKLSVNLLNHAHVKLGKVVNFDDEKLLESIAQGIYPDELDWCAGIMSNKPVLLSQWIGKGQYLKTEKNVVVIEGVWDLPMIGGERIYVLAKYHELIGGAEVELISLDGAFVQGADDMICKLQDQFDDMYGYSAARSKHFHKLRRLELNDCNNRRKEKLLALRKEKLEQLTEKVEAWRKVDKYFPACTLPENSILVVRTEALIIFEQLISDAEPDKSTSTKNHGNTEINAQKREQILGAALSVLANWPKQCENNSGVIEATKIRKLIEEKALLFWKTTGEPPLSTENIEREIRKWLNTVK